jgi:hypothetical protein
MLDLEMIWLQQDHGKQFGHTVLRKQFRIISYFIFFPKKHIFPGPAEPESITYVILRGEPCEHSTAYSRMDSFLPMLLCSYLHTRTYFERDENIA